MDLHLFVGGLSCLLGLLLLLLGNLGCSSTCLLEGGSRLFLCLFKCCRGFSLGLGLLLFSGLCCCLSLTCLLS